MLNLLSNILMRQYLAYSRKDAVFIWTHAMSFYLFIFFYVHYIPYNMFKILFKGHWGNAMYVQQDVYRLKSNWCCAQSIQVLEPLR